MFAEFTVNLTAVRANTNMSQQEFAKAIGVDKSTVFNWENGKGVPNATMLRKMSELSHIPMDYIFVPGKSE